MLATRRANSAARRPWVTEPYRSSIPSRGPAAVVLARDVGRSRSDRARRRQIAMCYLGMPPGFAQPRGQPLGDVDRAMAPTGAADADRQISLRSRSAAAAGPTAATARQRRARNPGPVRYVPALAAADRARSGGCRAYRTGPGLRALLCRAVAAVDPLLPRYETEDLSDDRHRLHPWAPSLGLRRRAAGRAVARSRAACRGSTSRSGAFWPGRSGFARHRELNNGGRPTRGNR